MIELLLNKAFNLLYLFLLLKGKEIIYLKAMDLKGLSAL